MRLDYDIPQSLLDEYHSLLSKKYAGDMSDSDYMRLETVTGLLDEADANTPLERHIRQKSQKEHEGRMKMLDSIRERLLQMLEGKEE